MLKSGVVVMAKNSKMNSLFGTELNGFKKRQVNEYIWDLEDAHRAKIEEYESAKAEMQSELDALNSQYTELLEKYNELQCEKAQVASVLINAENTAAKIVDEARKEGEAEKQRLDDEAEELRRTIVKRNGVIQDVKSRADNIFDSLLEDVRDAVASLEEYIAQGRAQFDEKAAEAEAFVAAYETEADNIGNEFDLDDESGNETSEEISEESSNIEDWGNDEDDGNVDFSELQASENGIEGSEFDSNFSEMCISSEEN